MVFLVGRPVRRVLLKPIREGLPFVNSLGSDGPLAAGARHYRGGLGKTVQEDDRRTLYRVRAWAWRYQIAAVKEAMGSAIWSRSASTTAPSGEGDDTGTYCAIRAREAIPG
jgi:hypothetical protein